VRVNRWNGIDRRAEARKPLLRQFELVVIGCSLGGMRALQTILSSIGRDFRVPVAVVQHRHKKSNGQLPEFFRRATNLRVADVEDKQPIKPGHVYLAPADYHLLVERGAFSLSVDERVAYSRPSIDVLFESAADAYGDRLIGVVLTGNNSDGSRGAKRVKARGGFLVVQDPVTAEARAMPEAAIAAAPVDRILPLERIGPFLVELCSSSAVVDAQRS
jgi:two-component system chemotaxis response regulator CheB